MDYNEISELLSKSKIIELILSIHNGNTNYSSIRNYIIRNFDTVSSSTISRQLDYLFKTGFVERHPIENRSKEFTHHPTEKLTKFAEAIKSLQLINSSDTQNSIAKIHKFRGGENSIKLEIELPESLRNQYTDNQELKAKIYFENDELLIKLVD